MWIGWMSVTRSHDAMFSCLNRTDMQLRGAIQEQSLTRQAVVDIATLEADRNSKLFNLAGNVSITERRFVRPNARRHCGRHASLAKRVDVRRRTWPAGQDVSIVRRRRLQLLLLWLGDELHDAMTTTVARHQRSRCNRLRNVILANWRHGKMIGYLIRRSQWPYCRP